MNPTDRLRHLLRRSSYYVTMRRIQREGPLVALRRRMLWARILDTAPVRMEPTSENAAAEVHLLCSRRDYLCAIWALKSFYCFSGVTCPLAIHLQGQSPERMVARMRQHFPDARIVLQAEADAFVEPELERAGFDRLLALRRKTPFMLKLTDFVLMCRAQRLLLLDSDVLFFAHARDLVERTRTAFPMALFQRDVANMYNISPARALERFGFHLAPCVNSGIALFARDAVNLARCEHYLSDYEVARPNTMVEQTLYALAFSEQSEIEYLPNSYLVSLQPCTDMRKLIARHYAGASRSLFTREGLPALIEAGFLEKLNVAN
ncbi:MAG TPA: hypothetical protein VNE82_05270 [Candidatus Binataceae bacterium]|nr:hypothetical protein [Candidatus Binataceae bacterium]